MKIKIFRFWKYLKSCDVLGCLDQVQTVLMTKDRHSDWSLKGIKQQIHSSFDIVLLYKIFSEEQKRLFPTKFYWYSNIFLLGNEIWSEWETGRFLIECNVVNSGTNLENTNMIILNIIQLLNNSIRITRTEETLMSEGVG